MKKMLTDTYIYSFRRIRWPMSKPFQNLFENKTIITTRFNRRRFIIFGFLFAVIGSYAIYSSFAASPTTANLWIDTNGGSCTRQATPGAYVDAQACSSMQAAMTAAQGGDTVIIKNGTYPAQTISSGTKATVVSFYAETYDRAVTAKDAFSATTGVYVTDLNLSGVDKIHIYGIQATPTPNNSRTDAHLTYAGGGELGVCDTGCTSTPTTDILIDGFHGRSAFLRATGVVIDHSSFGGWDACYDSSGNHLAVNNPGTEDGFRFWDGTGGSGTPTNSTIRNSVIHDIIMGINDSELSTVCGFGSSGGPHADCMQNNGGAGITVENNIFFNCPSSDIQWNPFSGATIGTQLIQNNYFGDIGGIGNSTVFGGQGSGWDCSGITVRNNFYNTDKSINTGGGCTAGVMQVYGNIFNNGGFSTQGANYHDNIFGANSVGTNARACTPTFITTPSPGPNWLATTTPDFHLASSDTCAKDHGFSTYPTTDFEGDSRPQGTASDAGPDEVASGPTANLWVDTNGGTCTRQATASAYNDAAACSWTAAAAAARSGDLILVKGGSYGNITFTSNNTAITSPGITYRTAQGESVTVTDFENGSIGGNTGQSNVTFVGPVTARSFQSDQTGNVTVDNWDVNAQGTVVTQPFHVENPTATFTLKNSRIHNVMNANAMTFLSGNGPWVIDNNDFYDSLDNTDGAIHTECIYATSVINMTFTRNHLWSCATEDIFITGNELATNWVVENNIFEHPLGPNQNALAFRSGGSPSPSPDGFILRYNTFGREAGIQINTTDNQVTANGFTVVGNVFTTQSPCGMANSTYDYNVFVSGQECGTHATVTSSATLLAGFVDPHDATGSNGSTAEASGNYHLVSGSVLLNAASPTSYPAMDRDGNSRPAGAAADAGAYEYVLSANVFVSTTGNDSTCVRNDSSKPCLSMNKAYAIASPGDKIQLAAGAYGAQTILKGSQSQSGPAVITFQCITVHACVVSGIDLGQNNGSITGDSPSYIAFDGIDVHGSIYNYYNQTTNPQPTHITFQNGHVWNLTNSGALIALNSLDNLTIKNFEIGPNAPNGDGIELGIPRSGSPSPSNIVFDNLYIHDVFDSCSHVPAAIISAYGSCSGTGYGDNPSGGYDHVDGLQIYGANNFLMQNSRVYDINNGFSVGQGLFMQEANGGKFSNVTIQNNMFGNTPNNDVSMSGPGSGSWTGYLHIYYNSIQGNLRLYGSSGSQIFAPGTSIIIAGNIIGDLASSNNNGCSIILSNGTTFTPTYSHNMAANQTCGASDILGTPTYVSSSATTPDLHLSGIQTAVDAGETTYCLATDIDSNIRPQGVACDIGADEIASSGGSDTTPPTVSVTAPTASAKLRGSVSLTASASDNVGVASVQFKLDGVNIGSADTTSPYSTTWDTSTTSNGSHTLTAVASDAAGNTTTSSSVTVTVDNTAPSVSVTTPSSGATVSGSSVSVTASASDNVGVVGVQFYLDYAGNPASNKLGSEDTTSPYSTTLNTTTLGNGTHTLTAIARDAAGNTTTSSTISVTVNNTSPPPSDTTAPSVPTGLAKTSATSSSVSLAWNASTDTGGSGLKGYKLYRNNVFIATILSALSYTDSGLSASTTYSYQISAIDNANNESAKSSALSAATTAISSPPPVIKKGDCNGDGYVTIVDLSILLSHYNTVYAAADFDSNSIVNITDLSILLTNYGK